MLQDLSELNFDAYFDVNNTNQQQRDILYHDEQTQYILPQVDDNIMLPSINSPDNRNYQSYLSQPNFNFFDWDIQPSPTQVSPSSSPLSSSDGYTSHSLSPSPSLYKTHEKKPLYLNVPGITIPSTPIHELSQQTIETNLPSPPLDSSLSDTFPTMNQWDPIKNDTIDPKAWRKTTRQANIRTINEPAVGPGKQLKKVAHNAIERRYRNNINDRIHELKNVVPALYKARICPANEDSSDSETEIVEGVEVAKKLNKATILKKATEYIQFLKSSNDKTDSENMILQEIISHMPGGQQVLSKFLHQKKEFEKSEGERLVRERQETQERERVERQKLLRERAAERAALAQLMPKQERRPYRRRQSKKMKSSSSEDETGGNKMFMAAFMCLVFFTAAPSSKPEIDPHLYQSAKQSSKFWLIARYILYAAGLFYFLLLPLVFHWLRPKPVKQSKKCAEHFHYDDEVPATWNRLYLDLVRSVGTVNSKRKDVLSILSISLSILFNFIYLVIPTSILAVLYKKNKPVGCPEELSQLGAWVQLNELECLGGNPHVTRLSMLHSTTHMLVRLHKMKRDTNYSAICKQDTLARIHATAALQLEMCLPASLASYLVPHQWKKMTRAVKEPRLSDDWLNSECHDQVLNMLTARNGFQSGQCRNLMYSFALPYMTSTLELVLYWQNLDSLKDCWLEYLNGVRPVFSKNQMSSTHMLQWWIGVGIALESLTTDHPEKALMEYLSQASSSSSLMRKHQSMMVHLIEATSALVQNDRLYTVSSLLEQATKERPASTKCIQQLSSTTSHAEATVLVLSTLAVHLRTLKALIVHGSRSSGPGFSAQQASMYIAQLRDQVLQDLESPFVAPLSAKCKKHIQLYIYQADDTLSL